MGSKILISILCLMAFTGLASAEDGSKNCQFSESDNSLLIEAKVNIESFLVDNLCSESYLPSLVETLNYLRQLEFEDFELTNNILVDLQSPWDFFIESYDALKFYKSKNAYASFDLNNKIMNVAGAMFTGSLPFSSSILIHEASHGRKKDAGHVQCWRGDLRFSFGGCDSFFETNPVKASSYSYQFWFLWQIAKYSKDLNLVDRKEILNIAKEILSKRFNFVLNYASFNDLLFALDIDGKALVLDPLTKRYLRLRGDDEIDQRYISIHNDYKSSSVLFYGKDTKFNNFSSFEPSTHLKGPTELNNKTFFDFRSLHTGLHFKERGVRPVAISTDGIAWVQESNDDGSDRDFVQFDVINDFGKVKSVELLVGQLFVVLYEDGVVRLFDGDMYFNRGEEITNISSMQPSRSFSSLYFLTNDGELLLATKNEDLISSGISVFKGLLLNKTDGEFLNGENPLIYKEALTHQAYLTDDGKIHLENLKPLSYESNILVKDQNIDFELSDFVFAQSIYIDESLQITDESEELAFKTKCSISGEALREPWLGRLMGLNAEMELIVLNEMDCLKVYNGVLDVKITKADLKGSLVGLVQSEVELTFINGTKLLINGY